MMRHLFRAHRSIGAVAVLLLAGPARAAQPTTHSPPSAAPPGHEAPSRSDAPSATGDEAPATSPSAAPAALDWCAAWYRTRVPPYDSDEAVSPGTPPPDPSTFRTQPLPARVPVTLSAPSDMRLRTYDDGAVVELAGGEHRHHRADDAFSSAPVPILQVRVRQSDGEPSWIRALERAGTLYPATQHVQRRNTTAGGGATEEICVHQVASHGHDTLMDGTHIPMPYEAELARGASWQVGTSTVEVAYRLPQDDVTAWAPVMDRIWQSLQVGAAAEPGSSPAPPRPAPPSPAPPSPATDAP